MIMALNKFMHQRNIYKTPPDFAKLANLYEEFSAISKVDISGNVKIDFKDPKSLRILTKCLLHLDFNLKVEIPEDRLVPTLPLRLNYILWIEDLMNALGKSIIHGIDIGTGACAIYPLLAATKNKWKMSATEFDDFSFQMAKSNIANNNLNEFIKLYNGGSDNLLLHLFDGNFVADFCMCNPPFYSSIQELCDSRSIARPPPKNGFTGSPQELITEGGELEFIQKLIAESKMLKTKVLVYTSMVGHKYNLKLILESLKSDGIECTHTEFCQGRVTRWGIAWTFLDCNLNTLLPPRDKPRKRSKPAAFSLALKSEKCSIDDICEDIRKTLHILKTSNKISSKIGHTVILNVIAKRNTWSNQRRKRRQEKQSEMQPNKMRKVEETDKDDINLLDVPSSSNLTKLHNSNNSYVVVNTEAKDIVKQIDDESGLAGPLLHFVLKITKRPTDIDLEAEYLNGHGGKEAMHQVIQYIKNNWK